MIPIDISKTVYCKVHGSIKKGTIRSISAFVIFSDGSGSEYVESYNIYATYEEALLSDIQQKEDKIKELEKEIARQSATISHIKKKKEKYEDKS